MSVELLIFYSNPDKDRELVPITGSYYFNKDWKPVAEKLKLPISLHFGVVTLGREDIPTLIDELKIFRGFYQDQSNEIAPSSRDNTLSNLKRLCAALEEAQNDPTVVRISIG